MTGFPILGVIRSKLDSYAESEGSNCNCSSDMHIFKKDRCVFIPTWNSPHFINSTVLCFDNAAGKCHNAFVFQTLSILLDSIVCWFMHNQLLKFLSIYWGAIWEVIDWLVILMAKVRFKEVVIIFQVYTCSTRCAALQFKSFSLTMPEVQCFSLENLGKCWYGRPKQ